MLASSFKSSHYRHIKGQCLKRQLSFGATDKALRIAICVYLCMSLILLHVEDHNIVKSVIVLFMVPGDMKESY